MAKVRIGLSLAFVALNLAVGGIVAALRLPIYLDSIGIVISAVLLGFRYGVLTGVVTALLGTFLFNPYLYAYTATALCIAGMSAWSYRLGGFDTLVRAMLSGLAIAIVAAAASAPVTAYLFSGNTMSGVDVITAYLTSTGRSLIESVWITGLTSEPVDKVMVAVLAYLVLRAVPKGVVSKNQLNSVPRQRSKS